MRVNSVSLSRRCKQAKKMTFCLTGQRQTFSVTWWRTEERLILIFQGEHAGFQSEGRNILEMTG